MRANGPLQISQDVVHEKIGEETVLLHLEAGVYFGLDPVGGRIWELLAETGDPRIVLERILEEYDVSSEVAARDLERLLDAFSEKNLVAVAPCGAGESR